ncbi:MAG: hypothetical protein ACT4TC_24490 [Myxococcaceae bacterium]
MAPARRPHPPTQQRLEGQVTDLELRVRLLEARLRRVTAESKPVPVSPDDEKLPPAKAKPRKHRERPRCMGCLLELPAGRSKDEVCVWCGFRLDVMPPRVLGK